MSKNLLEYSINIIITIIKHKIKPVGKHFYEITQNKFTFRFYDIFFVYGIIKTSCFFF